MLPEKYCHGTSAASANSAYGAPLDGTFSSPPNSSVNTTVLNSGCSTIHATPSAVCL